MSIPHKVEEWLDEQGHGVVVNALGVGGGCINNGMRLVMDSGVSFFLKTNDRAPKDMFMREAEGLDALAQAEGPRVPKVYLIGEKFLLLEDLAPAQRTGDYWQTLGRQLARMHGTTRERLGFDHDNYIGATPQQNAWMVDGYDFYAEHRYGYQAELAQRRGYFTAKEVKLVEQFAGRLRNLVPVQAASLLHGDLWSGNMIADERGEPAIIDPAVYYGWGEADLAMMALFGSPPNAFYQVYNESRPMVSGWRERFELYNLYHLMNHLNLFGRGYYGQVMEVLKKYAG